MFLYWIGLGFFLTCIFLICGFLVYELFRVAIGNGMPSLSSTRSIIDSIILHELLPRNGLILDLGCGSGRTLRRLSCSGLRGPFVGYERLFIPWAIGYFWKVFSRSNITLVRADALKAPIEEARGVYLFLLPNALKELAPYLEQRIARGTVIISAEFSIPGWEAQGIFEARGVTSRHAKIFVYKR